MLFTITGRHIDVTEALKNYAEEKTAKLPKYYDNINRIEVIIEGSKSDNVTVEIIAKAEHNKIFIVKETSEDAYKCIDIGVHKLERQLRKQKDKERNNKHIDRTELT